MPARLAQHLVQRGLLPSEKVNEALRRQTVGGGALDTVLLEQGVIAEAGMLQAIADVSDLRPVNLADFEPNYDVATLIPQKVADRLGIVPLSVDGNTLHVASVYPPSPKEIGEVGLLLGKQVELWVGIEARVRDWIAAIYKTPLPTRFAALLAALDPSRPLPATALSPSAPKELPVPQPHVKVPENIHTVVVDDRSLEESLTRDMVEQLARSVVEEPILLQTKKAPKEAARPKPEPKPQPEPDSGVARAPIAQRPPSDYEDTVVRPAYVPPSAAPPTWEREETKTLSPDTYAQFVRESQTAREPEARPPAALPSAPAVAPVTPPPPAAQPPRTKTEPSFEAVKPPEAPRTKTEPSFEAVKPKEEPLFARAPQAPPVLAPPPPQPPPPADMEVDIDFNVGPVTAPATTRAPEGVVVFPGGPEAAPPPGATDIPMPPVDRRPAAIEQPQELPPETAQYEEVPRWTLADAREALRQATHDREYIIDVALRFARQTFEFVCAFAVVRGAAVGWDARGVGVDRATLQQLSIPLDAQSVFRTVALTRGSFVGPLPPDELTHYFLQLMGRQPRTAFLFPVEVKGRLVAIIYGDNGGRPLSQRRLSDYILFCQDLPTAFQELILLRKRYLAQQWAEQQELEAAQQMLPEQYGYEGQGYAEQPQQGYDQGYAEQPVSYEEQPAEQQYAEPPGLAAAAPLLSSATEEAARPAAVGRNAWNSDRPTGLGRSASMPVFINADAERPPPDFTPILRRLVGPDAAERSRAMAELARTPEASAKVLTENFPGPTAWSRLPVMELPEADELGPIPAALVRLGRPAALALTPLLDSDDSDTRYHALLTAGNLPYPELVGGVLRGLFDYEPDISSAARAAASALRRVPRFDGAMKDLRKEMASRDPLRRSLAARALGGMHDRESIEGLINLTGSDDQMCAQAAAEALREITRANYGTTTRHWLAWWAEHRDKRRVEWVVAALRSRDYELRQAAIDELSRAVNDNLGYVADAPDQEREAAVRRWEALITQTERGRKFEL